MFEPFKSRFASIIHVQKDQNDWEKWALAQGLPMELIGAVKFIPELFAEWKPSADFVNSPTPRGLEYCAHIMRLGLPRHLETVALAGAIGEHEAGLLVSFLEVAQSMPNVDAILLTPETAPVPPQNSVLWMLAAKLATKATGTNMDRLVTYLNRIPAEYSTFCISQIIERENKGTGKPCQETRAFAVWAAAHQEFIS